MASIRNILEFLCLIALVCVWTNQVHGQRNLLHWKRDLEYRLNVYLNQRRIIDDIVASSIYAPPQASSNVVLRGNVRFTDLIIPHGSLLLNRHEAETAVTIMNNRTRSYVSSKMIELDQIRSKTEMIRRQLDTPSQQFIDKGILNRPQLQTVRGDRLFSQFTFGHIIETEQVLINKINHTLVDKVLNDTYMDNMQIQLRDSQSRLFFEGRKTFWRTIFQQPLRSGCCDRLRPLHTDRMMIRSKPQTVTAPVLFQTNDFLMREPVYISQLSTNLVYNSLLVTGIFNRSYPDGLLRSPPQNLIQLGNLIPIRGVLQPQTIFKTIVFRDTLMVDEAQLSYFPPERGSHIGFDFAPGFRFDLNQDGYLLKYSSYRNNGSVLRVPGRVIMNSETLFVSGLDSIGDVNRVTNFTNFILNNVVRIDQPATIEGSVQFSALPNMYPSNTLSRAPQNFLMMRALNLYVNLLNGMRVPYDVFFVPSSQQAYAQIRVRGPRRFVGQIQMDDFLQVGQLVNGIQMPNEVIPLHLNDFRSNVWPSNLWFLDGIDAQQVTVESGQFDDIILRDVHSDAQSLIISSMISRQIDGNSLIRAPLRVRHLIMRGDAPNKGLLNGFKPGSIRDLNNQSTFNTLYGEKTFLAPVEAIDCVFNDINHLSNWTNHLIRIDRPGTVQTVHTKLAFLPQPARTIGQQPIPSSVHANRFEVEFYPNTNPFHYTRNLNFSPELFILHQALLRGLDNHTGGRYRVLEQVQLLNPARSRVNGIDLNDIITLDQPFRFADRFVMVGKVEVEGGLVANRITSNYPIDAMDLVQFDKYRIPITGSRAPIRLNNLVLSTNNRASFVQCHLLNGVSFNEFANSIMSLTRPQVVDSNLVFTAPVNFEGLVRTESSLNGVSQFKQLTERLRTATYTFEDGLQCNSVVI